MTGGQTDGRILGQRDLNRATLARQSLLERSALEPVAAIERFGGFQAQEPASPYIALWTRLASFEPAALDRALQERTVVKATLMRGTLHLVTTGDYLHLQPAVRPTLQGLRFQDRFPDADVADIDAVAEEALAFAGRPRSNAEIHAHLASLTNGDVLPTFLVDGMVAGLWWAEPDGSRTRVELEPFRPITRVVRRDFDHEAARLATFFEPLEPVVYARYRRSRARR